MPTATLEEVQSHLPDLIANLGAGEELVITRDAQPVARLTAEPPKVRRPRVPGSAAGILTIVAEDDAHLADFAEYMG